jgi:thiamine-phosphate pyrophosphorylase
MQKISKLHYVTTSAALAEKACSGGIDWIQLRLKDISYNDYRAVARDVQAVCKAYKSTFIINDNAELALELGADGVHLGKEDMPPELARILLKDGFIIGSTANTSEDIVYLSGQPIDYIGLGPFRFTTTKQKLSPILGPEGYHDIFQRLGALAVQPPPVVAIGGITEADIPVLAATGLHGVAVSGSISGAAAPAQSAAALVKTCKQYFSHSIPAL